MHREQQYTYIQHMVQHRTQNTTQNTTQRTEYTEHTQFSHNPHAICIQFSHNPAHRTHTECTDTKQNNMQHIEQDNKDNREQDREQDTGATEKNTYTSTENSTYDLHTYSFDLYHEQIYIKNSNTIELYTILQDKI